MRFNQGIVLLSVLSLMACGGTDADGDGLTKAEEEELGLDPDVADTDGDGLDDGVEDADRDGAVTGLVVGGTGTPGRGETDPSRRAYFSCVFSCRI